MFIKSFVPKRRSLIVPREHVLTTITGVNNVSRIYNRVHWIIYETTIGDVRDLWIVEFDVSDRRWDKFIAQMASDGFELVITADGIVLRKGGVSLMAPLFVFAIFTTSFMNNNYLGGIIMAFINLIINWWNASWDTLSEVNAVLMDDGVHYY